VCPCQTRASACPRRGGHAAAPPTIIPFAAAHCAEAGNPQCAGTFGRFDSDGAAHTVLTRVRPTAKAGCILHYSAPRAATPREVAGIQSVAPGFSLGRLAAVAYRALGNAVVATLGRALLRVFHLREVRPRAA